MFSKWIQSLGSSWYVWFFPAIAIIICGLLFYNYESSQGPRIQIELDDASGVEPEKTTVRFHGVTVGTVKELKLAGDKGAEVEVLLTKEGTRFAVEGSRFSLVRPKASFEGITGLDTIFQGMYIVAKPGPEGGAKTTQFKAQKTSIEDDDDFSHYVLEGDDSESISPGDAITYRGIRVGQVSGKSFIRSGTKVLIKIKIENQYTALVRSNTAFWRKVGVQAQLGLFGAKIKMNSMESILNGGLQMATPSPAGPKAKAGEAFGLSDAAPKGFEGWAPKLD